jgi:hypothetical protein
MPTRSGRRGYKMGLQSAESVSEVGSGAQDCTTYWHRIGGAVRDLGYLPVETQILIFVHEAHLRRALRLLLIRMTREVLWGEGGRVRIYRRVGAVEALNGVYRKASGKASPPFAPSSFHPFSLNLYTGTLLVGSAPHSLPYLARRNQPPNPPFFPFLHGRGRIPEGVEHPSPPKQGSARGRFLWSVDNSSLLNDLNSNTHH